MTRLLVKYSPVRWCKSAPLCLLLLLHTPAFSQGRLDSLKHALLLCKEDTNKVNTWAHICDICPEEDILIYAEPAYALAQKLNYKKGMADALTCMGLGNVNKGEIEKAVEEYDRALQLRRELGDPVGIAQCLTNIGLMYQNQGQVEKALENLLEALSITEKTGDKNGTALCLVTIGLVYGNQGQLDKALEYDLRSLKIRQEIGDKQGIANSMNNIGWIYRFKGDLNKALEYFSGSLKIIEAEGYQPGIAYCLNDMGDIYDNLGKWDLALDYNLRALKIRETIGDKQNQAPSLSSVSHNYFMLKDYKHAEEYGKRALDLAREVGFPQDIRNASDQLWHVYKAEKKFREAYRMHVLYKEMADSISNTSTRRLALKKQLQFEFNQRSAAKKALQDKKDAVEREVKQRQILIIYAVSAGLLLVLAFAIIAFRGYRQKQQANLEIMMQKQIIEEKQKEILDSISYARRIQQSMLPTARYLERSLNVLKKPR